MLENNVFKVTESSEDKFWEKKPELPHVLLFSTKTDVTPLTKSLAVKFKTLAVFGQVKGDDGGIGGRYGVDSFPKLIIVKSKDDSNPVVFDGSISPDTLDSFIREHVGSPSSSEQQQQHVEHEEKKEETPAARVKKPKVAATLEKSTCETLQEQCKEKICVVGFVDATDDIDEHHKAVLDSVVEKFKSDGAFTFLWLDRNCPTWVEKFSLPNSPSLVLFNERRSRYITAHEFTLPSIVSVLERVLTGDAIYSKLQ